MAQPKFHTVELNEKERAFLHEHAQMYSLNMYNGTKEWDDDTDLITRSVIQKLALASPKPDPAVTMAPPAPNPD